MRRTLIKELLQQSAGAERVLVQGWVRTRRDAKACSFVEVSDGSSRQGLQVVVSLESGPQSQAALITTGASVSVVGQLVPSPGKDQKWELQAETIEVLGAADSSYPLQKKGHSLEYLREIAHLRPRSNLFGAVFRVRSRLAYAVHIFFQTRQFIYVHTPIITSNDCEGAGELFRVTTLDLNNPPKKENAVDYARDFFGRSAFLTVSGQLEAEIFACALSNVYTFGPTFRAENSNTSRHASEFWMIEPEMAFCDLSGNMDLAEEFLKYLIQDALAHCREDLDLFSRFIDKGLIERLEFILQRPFQRVPYEEALQILSRSGRQFEFPVQYGIGLQSEHERYLSEEHFKSPVTVFNFPKEIKPFYMRLNADERTVGAMDVLVPGIGEIIGGSQREERADVLQANMARHGLSESDYWWPLDLRRYGTVPHSGFGLGFERMLMLITGVGNIRDVIPFARTPGHAAF